MTFITERNKPVAPPKDNIDNLGLGMVGGAVVLLVWVAVLVVSIIVKSSTSYHIAKFIHWFEAFYLTGSVTYGGGQVVLPILENSVVQFTTNCTGAGPHSQAHCVRVESPDTWVTEQQFLAGLGLAQSLPGPLFNFSAYLGAAFGGFPGIVAAWLGLFGPGILIIYGVLPFWGWFRKWPLYQRATPGLNSTAVGLIFASVFSLGLKAYGASPFPTASVAIGMMGFWAARFLRFPGSWAILQPPLAVAGGAVLGVIAWAADCH